MEIVLTVTGTGVDVLDVKLLSPEYCAVIEFDCHGQIPGRERGSRGVRAGGQGFRSQKRGAIEELDSAGGRPGQWADRCDCCRQRDGLPIRRRRGREGNGGDPTLRSERRSPRRRVKCSR